MADMMDQPAIEHAADVDMMDIPGGLTGPVPSSDQQQFSDSMAQAARQ